MEDNIFDELEDDAITELYSSLFEYVNSNTDDPVEKVVWNRALMWLITNKISDMLLEEYIRIDKDKDNGRYYIELTTKLYKKFYGTE